jgi:predicted lipid-binding transport protein (Tim44 family)
MQMNKWIVMAVIGVIAASFTFEAEAQRRLGGARNLGKQSAPVQRQAQPPQQAPQQQTPQQTAPQAGQKAPAAAPAAAGAAARSASPWRGALMGLAAGLGIAALASWLGLGEAFASLLTVLLIGLAIAVVVGFVLRRMRGPQPAPGYSYGNPGSVEPRNVPLGYDAQPAPQPLQRNAAVEQSAAAARPGSAMAEFMRKETPVATSEGPWGIPAGFDVDSFLQHARGYFGKLQDAWDSGDLTALADFTKHELFTALTHELRAQPRDGSRSEVTALDASLLGIESNAVEHLASVRFTGALKRNGEEEKFDEVWNLSKPTDGRSGWLLAGIQQLS